MYSLMNTNIYVKDDQDLACGLAEECQVLLCSVIIARKRFLFDFKFSKIVYSAIK